MPDVPDPPIVHVPMSDIVCYRLQQHELDTLASGGGGTALLAFGTAFLSSGLSFLGCILSVPILILPTKPGGGAIDGVEPYVPVRAILLIVCAAVFAALGILLLILWRAKRTEVRKLLDSIHKRGRAAGVKVDDREGVPPNNAGAQ